MNIAPIYRAKIKNSDAYVIGFLFWDNYIMEDMKYFEKDICGKYDGRFDFGSGNPDCMYYEIDPSTLSIHFDDMLAKDSDRFLPNGEKDLRIFASLQENVKGGDIVILNDGSKETMECLLYKGRFSYKDYTNRKHWSIHYNDVKIIGIKE